MDKLQLNKLPKTDLAKKSITRTVFEKQSEGVSKIYEKMQESFSIKKQSNSDKKEYILIS
ncbi:hypothetical protein [Niabella aquatica]